MDRELEIAGAASAGGWLRWRKAHAIEPGTPCANCETPLQGLYCYNCGQLAEDFERSVVHLLIEGVESFFHFDGRFFRTLPNLAIRPGLLTRSYLEGKRAYQIPPMRLFLVVLLLVFFVGGLGLGGVKVNVKTPDQLNAAQKTAADKAIDKARARIDAAGDMTPEQKEKADQALERARQRVLTGSSQVVPEDLGLDDADAAAVVAGAGSPAKAAPSKHKHSAVEQWVKERLTFALKNRELFLMVLETWAHRFAILMLPIAALMLSALFVFQRRFYVFDHMIFSMHSLSFQGLLVSLYMALAGWLPFAGLLLWVAPVHLFFHMRGAYGTSIFGTLARMFLLFCGTVVAVVFLLMGLVWVGLSLMKPH